MSLTISYIGLLHTQLVGRVRTHGQQYLRARWGVLLPGLMLPGVVQAGPPLPHHGEQQQGGDHLLSPPGVPPVTQVASPQHQTTVGRVGQHGCLGWLQMQVLMKCYFQLAAIFVDTVAIPTEILYQSIGHL